MQDVNKKEIEKINEFAKKIRKNILLMSYTAGSSSAHFGGALSIVEIVSTLFASIMKISKGKPDWEDRDRFILSKGHACLAYYAALSEVGYLEEKELLTFEKNGTNLLGHPVKNKNLGIDFSNGSLGMGLSLGIGLALAFKKKKKNNNVFVILGDGECNEGSVWEAAMAAPNLNLNNLYTIIDKNNFQQTGSNEEIMNLKNLKQKWSEFGWDTFEVDGHNTSELYKYFNQPENKKPKALIANTVKGKGFSFSENNNEWHHKIMTKQNYMNALKELKHNEN